MVSKSTLLVSLTGIRSGKTIQTPINYIRIGDGLYATSSRNRTWWRNLRGGQPCTIWLEGKATPVIGTAIEEPGEVEPVLAQFMLASPTVAKYLGVQISPSGEIDPQGLALVASKQVMIRFDLHSRDSA